MNAKTQIANCAVLDTADDSHVTRQTPLDTKRREIENDLQYQSEAISKACETSTASKRKQNSIRPI